MHYFESSAEAQPWFESTEAEPSKCRGAKLKGTFVVTAVEEEPHATEARFTMKGFKSTAADTKTATKLHCKAQTHAARQAWVGFINGPENDEVLKATMTVAWLLVEGNDDDEQQRRLMGRYELVPGKWVCGRGVWQGTKQGQGQGRRYLYYSRGAEWVLGDREEDMETGAEKGLAKVGGGSKALTPCHAATSGWLVLMQAKAAASSSSACAR